MLFTTLLLCLKYVFCGGNELHITNASELIAFSKNVSSGTNYKGITVFLDNDIDFSGDFSEQLEPIGSRDNFFQGTLDGQGHIISNLIMNSSSQYTGLFGCSKEATIRNVVLGPSCSVVSSSTNLNYPCVGGIIGRCRGCIIENSVNVASVSFTGSTTRNLCIGGIAGYIQALNKGIAVRNCANYGPVTHSGNAYAELGGIAGASGGSSSKHIQNCLNYGAITHDESTLGDLYIGGILGYAYDGNTDLENCVNTGKIAAVTSKTNNYYVGSIMGYAGTTVNVSHCHWTSVQDYNKAVGFNDSSATVTVDNETSLITINTTTVNNLNNYSNTWNKWLLNTNSKSVTFKVNNGKGFILSAQIILLPSLAESDGHTFSGWFGDEKCATKFNKSSVGADTTLYGGWSYTVTFDFGNGTTTTKTIVYGQKYGELPTAERIGYSFNGWYTESNTRVTSETTANITASDHTLYAQWTINNYTLTFDYGNGTVVSEILSYNETINYPNPVREGYTFTGWNPKPDRMPGRDITVTAKWNEIVTEFVEIVFDTKDMTEKEIEDLVERFTDEEFTIIRYDEDKDAGETTVIIVFKDKTAAKNFVDSIRDSSDTKTKTIAFLKEVPRSTAIRPKIYSITALYLIVFWAWK